MSRIVDKFLLFLYSLFIAIVAVILILAVTRGIPEQYVGSFFHDVFEDHSALRAPIIITAGIVILVSLRLFFLSIRTNKGSQTPSIDQRTDFGEIRISLETIENLTLKAVSRVRGVKDIRSRIRIVETGLDITIRIVVDGESSIVELTEEIQRSVKDHVEEIGGIPVANVAVFVANVVASAPTKSRVE